MFKPGDVVRLLVDAPIWIYDYKHGDIGVVIRLWTDKKGAVVYLYRSANKVGLLFSEIEHVQAG